MDPLLDYYIDDIDTCINEIVISEQIGRNDNYLANSEINSQFDNKVIISEEIYKTDNEDNYLTDNAIVTDEGTYISDNNKTFKTVNEIITNVETYTNDNDIVSDDETDFEIVTDETYRTDNKRITYTEVETYTTEDEMLTDEENDSMNNEIVNNKKDFECKYPIGNIERFENVLLEQNISMSAGYESGGSESTLPMTYSEGNSFIFERLFTSDKFVKNQKQFKDISNNIILRPRRSIVIKNEIPVESIEIKKDSIPYIRKPPKEIIYKHIDIPEQYYEGRLLWGKLKSYPWWPCMIYRSPKKDFYKKNVIHVVYFGPRVERGWISVNDIFSYDGKEKYDALVKKLISENASKKVLKDYNYPSSKIASWNKSWREAETALFKTIPRRVKDHGIMYKDASGQCTVSDIDDSDDDGTTLYIPLVADADTDADNKSDVAQVSQISTRTSPQLTVSLPFMASKVDMTPSVTRTSPPLSSSSPVVVAFGKGPLSLKAPSPPQTVSIQSIAKQKSPRSDGIEQIDENMSIASFHSNHYNHNIAVRQQPKRQKAQRQIISKIEDDESIASTPSSHKSVVSRQIVKPMPQKIILEYLDLKAPTFGVSKRTSICLLCLGETDLPSNPIITCAGSCSQTFHANCMIMLLDYLTSNETEKPILNYNKCVDCNRNQRRCFMCRKLGNIGQKKDFIKCCNGQCGRYFHSDCLNNGVYHNLVLHNRHGSVTCPSHTCHSCHLENPSTVRHSSSHVRCIMCPASFHKGDWCIPAGSKEINSFYIICPQHLKNGGSYDMSIMPFMNCIRDGLLTLNKLHFKLTPFNDPENVDLWILEKPLLPHKTKPSNVTWCFICSKGGDLICCEKCPASLHQHCAQIDKIPESFLCDECEMGKYPRYGEIFWLKIGNYRWWPAQIVHSKHAPPNVLRSTHGEGQFLVLFFGTNDYHWCNKTQAFMFDEGDDESSATNDNSSSDENVTNGDAFNDSNISGLERAYRVSLKTAGKAYRRRNKKWGELVANGNKPTHYRTIRNNVPIGKVRINKTQDVSEVHQCECRPGSGKNDRDPCGPSSDCINRQLNYECNPVYCRNGVKCRNQRFMLRQYPQMEIFCTPDRGWALKINESIKQGTFVIEYVGEVIDEEESNRRLKTSHENNVTNFYMMELDAQRTIDAGPAANISRFMNHSCSPNVFTQRWVVNGDIRVGVFAINDIEADEELTFNYNFLSLGDMKIPCKCGAINCSGFLGVPPKVLSSSSDLVSLDTQDIVQSTKHKQTKKAAPAKAANDRRALKTKRDHPENPPPIKKVAREKKTVSTAVLKPLNDDFCFVCRGKECNLSCGYEQCPRQYHSRCVELPEVPTEVWFCPWHFCDDCGKLSDSLCWFCAVSFCGMHRADRVVNCTEKGPMACLDHCDLFRQLNGLCPDKADSNDHSNHQSLSNTSTESPQMVGKCISDVYCFMCRAQRCDISCSYDQCPRSYHSQCVELFESPEGVWFCPWHFCDDCGRLSDRLCSFCVVSFCAMHLADRVIDCLDTGEAACLDHYEVYNQKRLISLNHYDNNGSQDNNCFCTTNT